MGGAGWKAAKLFSQDFITSSLTSSSEFLKAKFESVQPAGILIPTGFVMGESEEVDSLIVEQRQGEFYSQN